MPRSKVKLTYIQNDTARKIAFNKRVKGLLKKTEELSVLCGVDACAIVYSPHETTPAVWPPSRAEATKVVSEFRGWPDLYQAHKEFTQETFLSESVTNSEKKLAKMTRRNLENSMQNVMLDLLDGKPVEEVPFGDVDDLKWVIEDRIRNMKHRIRVVEGTDNNEMIHF